MLNSRDIDLLRPDVAANCHLWVERCRAAGLNVLVTNTVRDREYQAYLYEQGRTRPGGIVTNSPVPTFHADTSGLAFDFCKNVKGHEWICPTSSGTTADGIQTATSRPGGIRPRCPFGRIVRRTGT